jgi:hypothetical protein
MVRAPKMPVPANCCENADIEHFVAFASRRPHHPRITTGGAFGTEQHFAGGTKVRKRSQSSGHSASVRRVSICRKDPKAGSGGVGHPATGCDKTGYPLTNSLRQRRPIVIRRSRSVIMGSTTAACSSRPHPHVLCCDATVRFWREADMPDASLDVRLLG